MSILQQKNINIKPKFPVFKRNKREEFISDSLEKTLQYNSHKPRT